MERIRKAYLYQNTRGIIDAILNGDINNVPTKKIPYFDFEVPTELNGVDTGILDPRDTYADASEWETKAKDLAARFIKNFSKYEGNAAGKHWFLLVLSYNFPVSGKFDMQKEHPMWMLFLLFIKTKTQCCRFVKNLI